MLQFFNPKMSTITIGASVIRKTIQVAVARALDPSNTSMPKRGERRYDNENASYFSLTPIECLRITQDIQPLLEGTYVNQNEKESKFKSSITIIHFRDKQPSRLIISRGQDSQGKPTNTVILSLISPNLKPISYIFRPDELRLFREFIRCGYSLFPFVSSIYEGIKREKNREEWQRKSSMKKEQGGQAQSQQSRSIPEETVVGPTFDDSVGPVDEVVENVDELGLW